MLSTENCSLPSLFGLEEWKKMELDKGWTGMILCMMWEQAKGKASKWSEYLSILPDRFDTPMFWDRNDLYELEGTVVVEKIGKDQANQEYLKKILPALQSRTDIFPLDTWTSEYSLETYHIMGSRILSRSFHVEPWHDASEDSVDANPEDTNEDVDATLADSPRDADIPGETDAEEDEEGVNVAMVPMADMLNARFESENCKLFHEHHCLKMVSTKAIKAGGQIWNTYGDLPNAELLRRYGHVDLVPLPGGGVGNPGDVVEIRADIVVDATLQHRPTVSAKELRERIDWWLDEGGDDVIIIESDHEIPVVMLSLVRLFLLPEADWERAKSKSKPPKAKLEPDVLQVLITTFRQRLEKYPSSLDEDEKLMQQTTALNHRHAIAVRMGEKRILTKTLNKLQDMSVVDGNVNKRKRLRESGEKRAKTRI
ncbi:hypothetical protein AX15_003242 [Amanita polypyramis BW_CC]|nr:hypothetical protein AX15_003242 [Amanita polypyramis BW_CC]